MTCIDSQIRPSWREIFTVSVYRERVYCPLLHLTDCYAASWSCDWRLRLTMPPHALTTRIIPIFFAHPMVPELMLRASRPQDFNEASSRSTPLVRPVGYNLPPTNPTR